MKGSTSGREDQLDSKTQGNAWERMTNVCMGWKGKGCKTFVAEFWDSVLYMKSGSVRNGKLDRIADEGVCLGVRDYSGVHALGEGLSKDYLGLCQLPFCGDVS